MEETILDLLVLHDEELKNLKAHLPSIRSEMENQLAAKVAELSAVHAEQVKAEMAVRHHAAAQASEKVVINELTAKVADIQKGLAEYAEKSLAALLVKHEGKVAEIAPQIVEMAKAAASQVTREYSEKQPDLPELIKKEFAALPSIGSQLIQVNKGQWSADESYAPGSIVAFRGGSYLVLKQTRRGEFPTTANQKGNDPVYQLLAAPGSPGPKGLDAPAYSESVNITALDINWARGSVFYKTLTASSTFTFSNTADGAQILVILTNTASNYTVTWPTVSWPGNIAPTQTVGAKSDVYVFVKVGSTIYGNVVQNYS